MIYGIHSMIEASIAIFLNPEIAGFPGTVFVAYPASENARWYTSISLPSPISFNIGDSVGLKELKREKASLSSEPRISPDR